MIGTSSAIALPQPRIGKSGYPIFDQDCFLNNKESFFGVVFYCPECARHYCWAYNHTDAYCQGCFYEGVCMRRGHNLRENEEPPIPQEKYCLSCHRELFGPAEPVYNFSEERSKIISFYKKKKVKKDLPSERRKRRQRVKATERQERVLRALCVLYLCPSEVRVLEKIRKRAENRQKQAQVKSCDIRSFQSMFPAPACAYQSL